MALFFKVDGRAGDGGAALVDDRALDHAGGGLGLGPSAGQKAQDQAKGNKAYAPGRRHSFSS